MRILIKERNGKRRSIKLYKKNEEEKKE